MLRVELPVFGSVVVCVLLLPTVLLPKFKRVGLAESLSVATMPVPLRDMAVGEFGGRSAGSGEEREPSARFRTAKSWLMLAATRLHGGISISTASRKRVKRHEPSSQHNNQQTYASRKVRKTLDTTLLAPRPQKGAAVLLYQNGERIHLVRPSAPAVAMDLCPAYSGS
jgi:hypothetical protein